MKNDIAEKLDAAMLEISRLKAWIARIPYAFKYENDPDGRRSIDYTWPEAYYDVSTIIGKSGKLYLHIPRSLDGDERMLNKLLNNARDLIDCVLSSKEYKHENGLDIPARPISKDDKLCKGQVEKVDK
jgi:hypothetical protein